MKHAECYRKGYPRPRFVRKNFTSLDGEWGFSFDDKREGERKRFYTRTQGDRTINVPYAYQTKKSGIGDESRHDCVWYFKRFDYNLKSGRLLIHFEGADYRTKVFLNGRLVGTHTGGYTRFTFDLTDYLKRGANTLAVMCEDSYSLEQPRGKQRHVEKNVSCFYTDTTGIWKSVWLEGVADSYLEEVIASCEYENQTFLFEYRIARYEQGLTLAVETRFEGERVGCVEQELFGEYGVIRLDATLFHKMLPMKPWSAGRPQQIFDVTYTLKKNGKIIDEVASYTALVDYRVKNGHVQVNYLSDTYFRMVLAQGYYGDGGLTATEDELLRDVLLIKEMGFNGVRMHQKIEDDRFYYFCDMAGLYCWLEMPAAYGYSVQTACAVSREWSDIVRDHKGFLSVMAYVPVNESWGVLQTAENERMQAFTAGLYFLTRAIDPRRLVISNDGWEHTASDIVTLHNYAQTGRELSLACNDIYGFLAGKPPKDAHTRTPFANGWAYEDQPVIVSEYGGIAYRKGTEDGWGYGKAANGEEEYLARLRELTGAILASDAQGYCYTQFTDVMQEQNGLLTETREFKIPAEKILEINRMPRR